MDDGPLRPQAPAGRHHERNGDIVEPTGAFVDDPNLTDQRFPGNPTQSYRSQAPLRVLGEVEEWQGHSPEQLRHMKDHLARLKEQGVEAID